MNLQFMTRSRIRRAGDSPHDLSSAAPAIPIGFASIGCAATCTEVRDSNPSGVRERNRIILGPMFVEAWPDNGQFPFAWFNNQYDLDGNVVYAGRDLKVPEYNGVATVSTERETDMRMFDLMGSRNQSTVAGHNLHPKRPQIHR